MALQVGYGELLFEWEFKWLPCHNKRERGIVVDIGMKCKLELY